MKKILVFLQTLPKVAMVYILYWPLSKLFSADESLLNVHIFVFLGVISFFSATMLFAFYILKGICILFEYITAWIAVIYIKKVITTENKLRMFSLLECLSKTSFSEIAMSRKLFYFIEWP